MKAVALVAHPDDCVIFAYSFIHAHPQLDWTVCYLTYTEHDYRGSELAKFWRRRCIATRFLGYVDDWHDIENKAVSFDATAARQDIENLCGEYDVVLTHDAEGDYGHIHHRFVHDSVPKSHPHIVTFAPPNQGTDSYTIPAGVYSVDELPQHGEIVGSFHRQGHVNSYNVSSATKILLDLQHN